MKLSNKELKSVRKKGIFLLVFAVLIIVAIISFVVKIRSAGAVPVQKVIVTGELDHIDQAALINSLKPLINKQGFFGVDLASVREQVQQLPWVANAEVKRVWPNELMITIRDQEPVAIWSQAGLVNPYGEVFYPVTQHYDKTLPDFFNDNPQNSLLMLDQYQQMSAMLTQIDLNIAIERLDQDGSWQITLSNGIKLQLGREDTLTRLQRFVKVYGKVFNSPNKHAESVDLRYNNGMAVEWQGRSK